MKRRYPARPLDNHWRSNHDEYEFLSRSAYENGVTIADTTREKLFPTGWRKKLEDLRRRHRKENVPEYQFFHPREQLHQD